MRPEKIAAPEASNERREDIAGHVGVETIGHGRVVVSPDQFHWVDAEQVVNTAVVASPHGEFEFGSIVGCSKKLADLAQRDMRRSNHDDNLNRQMYQAIVGIIGGNPAMAKRMRREPPGTVVYYTGTTSTKTCSRIFFIDAGRSTEGRRLFLKTAVGVGKQSEGLIMQTLSGYKKERVA